MPLVLVDTLARLLRQHLLWAIHYMPLRRYMGMYGPQGGHSQWRAFFLWDLFVAGLHMVEYHPHMVSARGVGTGPNPGSIYCRTPVM